MASWALMSCRLPARHQLMTEQISAETGCRSRLFRSIATAPPLISTSQQSSWPLNAARCNAVYPPQSVALTLAPACRSRVIASTSPHSAASPSFWQAVRTSAFWDMAAHSLALDHLFHWYVEVCIRSKVWLQRHAGLSPALRIGLVRPLPGKHFRHPPAQAHSQRTSGPARERCDFLSELVSWRAEGAHGRMQVHRIFGHKR